MSLATMRRYAQNVPRPGPLLRLVSSLERRRHQRGYRLELALRNADSGALLSHAAHHGAGPRAFVFGAGERAVLALPGLQGRAASRHIAIVTSMCSAGVLVRALSLHAERGLDVSTLSAPLPTKPSADRLGGALAVAGMRVLFDGYALDIVAAADNVDGTDVNSELWQTFTLGTQLSFFSGASVRAIGDVLASVAGPAGGGHAIPALLTSADREPLPGGTLVLRTRTGVHRVDVSDDEIRRGVLIGRSRRCVLGRGFDENDGLSRVHALVIAMDDGVVALDLASRYGLRDVSRPTRATPAARLDDGIGCLVYGAGLLTFEPD